jgi:hypothetical protein
MGRHNKTAASERHWASVGNRRKRSLAKAETARAWWRAACEAQSAVARRHEALSESNDVMATAIERERVAPIDRIVLGHHMNKLAAYRKHRTRPATSLAGLRSRSGLWLIVDERRYATDQTIEANVSRSPANLYLSEAFGRKERLMMFVVVVRTTAARRENALLSALRTDDHRHVRGPSAWLPL